LLSAPNCVKHASACNRSVRTPLRASFPTPAPTLRPASGPPWSAASAAALPAVPMPLPAPAAPPSVGAVSGAARASRACTDGRTLALEYHEVDPARGAIHTCHLHPHPVAKPERATRVLADQGVGIFVKRVVVVRHAADVHQAIHEHLVE